MNDLVSTLQALGLDALNLPGEYHVASAAGTRHSAQAGVATSSNHAQLAPGSAETRNAAPGPPAWQASHSAVQDSHGVLPSSSGAPLPDWAADLPYEVWRGVALWLDLASLRSFMLTCRACLLALKPTAEFHQEWHAMWYWPDAIMEERELLGHSWGISHIAMSADGRCMVSSDRGGVLRAWDLHTGDSGTALVGSNAVAVAAVVLTPCGQYAVSRGWEDDLRVWDLHQGLCTSVLRGHSGWVRSVAMSPDGAFVVSASEDRTLRVWGLPEGGCTSTLTGHSDYVMAVAVDPSAQLAVSGSNDNTLRVWKLESGECAHLLTGHSNAVNCVVITPDGQYAVSGAADETLRVWDLQTGHCTAVFQQAVQGRGHIHTQLAVTPDGWHVLSRGLSNLEVWDLYTGALTTLAGHSQRVWGMAATPCGRYAVTCSRDTTLRVWQLLEPWNCVAVLRGHGQEVYCMAISRGGRYVVSGSHDGTLRVWDLAKRMRLS